MSIYPDKKNGKLTGRWYVEVQIKGQRKRGRFNTMEDAKRAEARFRTELAAGDTVGATLRTDRVAPETLAHLWAKASEMMWRDNRHGKLSRAKLAWILQEIGDFRLHSIPADYGDRLIRRLEEDGKKPGTVNRYIAAISAVLHWGKRRGYVQFTPAFDMRREERGRTRWLTNEEEYQLISTLRAFDYADVADLCIVAIDTGCRLGELLGVQHQLNGDRLHLWKTKNDKPRTVPLTPRAQAILEARLPWSINEKRLRTAWEKAKDAMGLSHDKEFVFHALRHTCCTRLCRMRPAINILTIKKWMGHERIETTMRYAQIADDMLEEARDMLAHGVGQEPRRVWGGVGQEPPGVRNNVGHGVGDGPPSGALEKHPTGPVLEATE